MKRNLIINIITLAVTSMIFVLLLYGWYVSNTEVTASGIQASTGSNKLYVSSNYSSDYTSYVLDENDEYLSTFTNFDENYWGTNATISSNVLLLPSSTPDGSTFYYTNDVSSDGTAFQSYTKKNVTAATFVTDGSLYIKSGNTYTAVTSGTFDASVTYYTYGYNFLDVTNVGNYYYIEKSIYICNGEATDLNCCLRKVDIKIGTDEEANIYKAARVYLESGGSSNIFKYYDSETPNAGNALPANSATTILNSDPAINSGSIADNILQFTLPGVTTEGDVKTYSSVEVRVKIWVEGQNANALATYAGKGFNLDLLFVTV